MVILRLALVIVAILLSSSVAWGQPVIWQQATGTITTAGADCTLATSCVQILDSRRTANGVISLTGTWTGTALFEGWDGVQWFSLLVSPFSSATNVSSATANGQWTIAVPLIGVRIRASALTAGSITVSMWVTSAGGGGGGGGGGSVTQGTAPWLVAPDGTLWARTGTSANVASIPSDATTASTALGAASATIAIALSGQVGAVFQLQSGGTGVYTVTPQCSFDGGSTYPLSVQLTDPSTGLDAPTVTISSGQGTTPYTVVCPFSASHVQMKVTSYTSGTANWIARATVGGFPNSVPTLLTAAPTVSASNTAATVTLTGATGQRVCVYGIAIYVTGATSTTVTLTLSDGATAVMDLGIPQLSTLSAAITYDGSPILCGSTGNNVVVNIGAGGTSVVTHTSVMADRR